jgi:hypothetical protein
MKKELKDYAPFYIGCECVTPDGVMIFNCLNVNDNRNNVWFYCRWNDKKNCYEPKKNAEILLKSSCVGKSFKYSEIKLILRPLSDITDEEAIIIAETTFTDIVPKEDKAKIGRAFIDYNFNESSMLQTSKIYNDISEFDFNTMPEIFKFLLSQHFDLFDLIEAGLAIDAATLKQKT